MVNSPYYRPSAFSALLPTAGPDTLENELPALARILKTTEEEASWTCPDCGQLVQPRNLNASAVLRKQGRWLPRTHCDCKGGAERHMQARLHWLDMDAARDVQNQRAALLRGCGLDGSGLTFDSWHADTAGRKKALGYARRLVQQIAAGGWSFWFGPFGCGKTHLAHAIASELVMEHGRAAIVVNWLARLRDIQETWGTGDRETPLWRGMTDAPVLFLDDFDKNLPRPSDLRKPHVKLPASWYMESLYYVIDTRYQAGRSTVLISNLSYIDLETVLQAIGGTAVDAVLSRFNRSGAVRVDWGAAGLTEYASSEHPAF